MKCTEFIVEYLKKHEKLSHVFTYAGGTNAWLLDVLHKSSNIGYIPMRHEQNAAFAAEGYARAGERLGVVLTMSGPGATNLVTGIANAFFDSVPVLYLTGQVTSMTYKFDNPVRQLGYQETDIVSIVKPITKNAVMARTETEVASFLQKSISIARSGRPGPVLLDLPTDVQRKEVTCAKLDVKPICENGPCASNIKIGSVIKLIQASKRPIILAGGGVRVSGTCDLLMEFADRFQIPVVASLMGKDSFPNDHPLFVGFIGSYGNRYANLSLANCDLVIALGSRLDSRQTANPKTFARAAKIVHVDIDLCELENAALSDLSIHSDLRKFFEKILRFNDNQIDVDARLEWKKYIRLVKAEFYTEPAASRKKINPKLFLRKLSDLSAGNEIFTADVGNNQMWAAQELKIKKDQRFIVSGGLGSMGFAIPAAIGAHFACPDRPVISIVGDGGFQMSTPELETIVSNNIPVKIIVFNNNVLGLMWHFQGENFDNGHPATEDGYSCPDIQKVASAYGLPCMKLENERQMLKGISWILSAKGPALLEVMVDRSWAAYPKVKPGNPIEIQLPKISKKKQCKYMLIPLLDD